MKFSVGVITSGKCSYLDTVIDSIKTAIPHDKRQVIVVGGEKIDGVEHIEFDESIKTGWITKKKNLITQKAIYDNVVYMHDYYYLDSDWYNQFVEFGDNWDVCMNTIRNVDGSRFRDWCVWDDPKYCFTQHGHRAFLAPYSYSNYNNMYVSGGYWVAKRQLMLTEPLNEELCWGKGEDVEWSKRVLGKYSYKMNVSSITHLLKAKEVILGRLPNE